MTDIVLSSLNAKYIHTAFGLRCLMANLGELQPRATIAEFDLNKRPLDIAEAILEHDPRIVGLGVYIWNATQTTELVAILKKLRPDLTVILGGPEVSYEWETQAIVGAADYVVTGEADLEFARLCRQLLASHKPEEKIVAAALPDLARVAMPYDRYSEPDLKHRIVYVEASRGCPFSCEFCLSSLDIPLRSFPLAPFLAAMQRLLDRGLKHFKFVDRTFNLHLETSRAILEFFLERCQPDHVYHFELVPDRLPESLREIIARFPPGALHFEIGIQTFDEPTAERISRRQDYERLEDNFRFLRRSTGAYIHSDLIVGLPGEDLESFAKGFDRLIALEPHEIQVGILKRLRGAPIARHTAEWEMRYHPNPPYEILANRLIPFAEMQRMRRFARYWDLVGNSGNFKRATPLFWRNEPSPFAAFQRFSDWLYGQVGRTDSIALPRLMELVFKYLTVERELAPGETALALFDDYKRGGRRDTPGFLLPHLPADLEAPIANKTAGALRRQARHLARDPEPPDF